MKKIISILLFFILSVSGFSVFANTDKEQTDKILGDIECDTTIIVENKVLQKDIDYYITYYDNVKVGTGKIVVHFIGNYTGVQERSFNIRRRKNGNTIIPSPPVSTDTPIKTPTPTDNPTDNIDEGIKHIAYIEGYDDLFYADSNMTRAEAAAVFAKLISEDNNSTIDNQISQFNDVDKSNWYSKYIAYLENFNVISGYEDATFRPDEAITRAEFVTMCTQFIRLLGFETKISDVNIFIDVPKNHWALQDISTATKMKWIEGYDDGMFKPDNNITRAEVVAIVNRVLERTPDEECIMNNLSELITFKDVSQNHWAYGDIVEASNTHFAVQLANGKRRTE